MSARAEDKSNRAILRLPWLGDQSAMFKRKIQKIVQRYVPLCYPICCLTTRKMFSTTNKDVLPMTYLSNVIYLFTCECDHRYIGRTTQRLGGRIEQHIPNKLVRTVTGTTKPVRTRRSRAVKNMTVSINKGRRKSTPIKPPATVMRQLPLALFFKCYFCQCSARQKCRL